MTKSKELYNVLVSLNRVCIIHKSVYHTYPPKINMNYQDKHLVIKEINKIIKYLEYPQYSYLSK
jgi:hypothetical protein